MSYAHAARSVFLNMLGTLDHLVGKAIDAGLRDDVLTETLADDMFPLELQFRVALNQVLLAINQLTRHTVPLEETTYRSLADVRSAIASVGAQIARVEPADFADPSSVVDLTLPHGVRFLMSAEEDVRDWLLPNFYFHVTMAYALLRRAGLDIGKMDFVPHMKTHLATTDSPSAP